MTDFIDPKEAGEILGLSRQWVTRLLNGDKLPAQRVGARWVLDRADVEAYKHRRETNPTPQEADHLKRKAKRERAKNER